MEYLVNEQIDKLKWTNFVENNVLGSPFQLPEYYELYNSLPGYSADVIAIEESGNIQALCVIVLLKESGLKGYFSRRAIIYGGPVLIKEKDFLLDLLLNIINTNYKRKVIYIETRNLESYNSLKNIFQENKWKYDIHLNFHLDCSNLDMALKRMHSTRRRQIRSALKNETYIETAQNISEVQLFYNLLKDLYHIKIKKPLMPWLFFKLFFEKQLGVYLLVKYNNQIIGGIMCPILKNQKIYEWYIVGLDKSFKKQYPSVMATYAAIEFGAKNYYTKFDFMGAGKPNNEYNVRDFKSKFGGELVEYGRFLKIFNPMLYFIGKLGLKFIYIFK